MSETSKIFRETIKLYADAWTFIEMLEKDAPLSSEEYMEIQKLKTEWRKKHLNFLKTFEVN